MFGPWWLIHCYLKRPVKRKGTHDKTMPLANSKDHPQAGDIATMVCIIEYYNSLQHTWCLLPEHIHCHGMYMFI